MTDSDRRGAIGVIRREDGHYLVIERAQTVRAPGRYCFPGGGMEPGETEQQTVQRELREELSLDVRPVRRLWQSRTQSGVHLHWWLVEISGTLHPAPNPAEVACWFWMSASEIALHPKTLATNREFIAAVKSGIIELADDRL